MFIPLTVLSQFSGEITYEYKIIPKSINVNVDSLYQELTGTTSTYLITDSYYKSTYFKNGEVTYSYTYHDETKRMYDNQSTLGYITYRDSRVSDLETNDFEIFRDSTIEILGETAILLKTNYSENLTKSYYSTERKVNYKTFEGHQVANWYNRLKSTGGGILLKSITYFETHTEILKAINISERLVDRNEFDLPADKPIAASASALDERVELKTPTNQQIRCYQTIIKKASGKLKDKNSLSIYLRFIVTKNGKIKQLSVVNRDKNGLYLAAIDVLKSCKLSFIPGKINGESVDSETYFPINF